MNEFAPDPYLTPTEMRSLTESRVYRCQVEWLDANGWPYVTNRNGRPKVLRAYHDAKMNGQKVEAVKAKIKEPNWSKAA